jgi:hypothetical protein
MVGAICWEYSETLSRGTPEEKEALLESYKKSLTLEG